jgi:alpha-N-arabinofuranosidase
MENGVRVDGKKRHGNLLFDGLSLHHYTTPGEWAHKGDAIDFNEKEWLVTMRKASSIDSIIRKHGEIMDRYDPERKIGMIVDEWGTWFDADIASNPRHLYQQNTVRDALVAGIHLNAFNNYCERVHMANIAQTVNVLQALVLTEGARMLLTPTYHVFDMFKGHQDALKLPVHLESGTYGSAPTISASASLGTDRVIRLSLTNADPDNEQQIPVDFRGITLSSSINIKGRIITSDIINAHNTFDNPNNVKAVDFNGFKIADGELQVVLPPKSVVTLELK